MISFLLAMVVVACAVSIFGCYMALHRPWAQVSDRTRPATPVSDREAQG